MTSTTLRFTALSIVVAFLTGCGQQQADKSSSPSKVGSDGGGDVWASLSRQFRLATEVAQYKDAVQTLNGIIAGIEKPLPGLSKEEAAALKAALNLDANLVGYLDSSTMRPLDAYHLESCFTLRDAAQFLEIKDLPFEEQARVCLDWVCRRVVLHEQGEAGLPPLLVLRQGHGGELDRAVVFLELLRQLGDDGITGCVLQADLPDGGAATLVAVQPPDTADLLLYDPRLGTPVRGPDKKAASLALVAKQPGLLKPHGLPEDAAGRLQARLACSLASLAPRMRWLEEKLDEHQRVTLYQNPVQLAAALKKAGLTLTPWEGAQAGPRPADAWWRLAPPKEGGIDETNYGSFHAELTPLPHFASRLRDMNILGRFEQPAKLRLLGICNELFVKFILQPGEMSLRGKPAAALERLRRIEEALDSLDVVRPKRESLARDFNRWCINVNEAYTALDRKEKGADRRLNLLWDGDPFLRSLLDVTNKERLADKLGKERKKEAADEEDPNVLSFIVDGACRFDLIQGLERQRAFCQGDKAARAQAAFEVRRAAAKDAPGADSVRPAWREARAAWKDCAERLKLPEDVQAFLISEARSLWSKGDLEHRQQALLLMRDGTRAMQESLHARWQALSAARRLSEGDDAAKLLEKLQSAVEARIVKDLGEFVRQCRAEVADGSPFAAQLNRLARNWSPRGAWAAWRDLASAPPAD